MWGSLIEELRRAGPRKVAVVLVAAAVSVAFAYGVNSTNDAANVTTSPTSTAHSVSTAPVQKP